MIAIVAIGVAGAPVELLSILASCDLLAHTSHVDLDPAAGGLASVHRVRHRQVGGLSNGRRGRLDLIAMVVRLKVRIRVGEVLKTVQIVAEHVRLKVKSFVIVVLTNEMAVMMHFVNSLDVVVFGKVLEIVLSDWGVNRGHSWVMVNVGGRVVRRWLRRVVRVLVEHNWLVVVVMVWQIVVVVIIMSRLVVRFLVVVGHISECWVVNRVIFMEAVVFVINAMVEGVTTVQLSVMEAEFTLDFVVMLQVMMLVTFFVV